MFVHIVGWEGGKDSGGFCWFPEMESAAKAIADRRQRNATSTIYWGALNVPNEIINGHVDGVTEYVEKYLEENDWENSPLECKTFFNPEDKFGTLNK